MSENKETKFVWLLWATMDYEGSYVIDVYASEQSAEKHKARIERSFEVFSKKNEEWTKATDAEDDSSKWPESPKFPEHHGYDISITKRRVKK